MSNRVAPYSKNEALQDTEERQLNQFEILIFQNKSRHYRCHRHFPDVWKEKDILSAQKVLQSLQHSIFSCYLINWEAAEIRLQLSLISLLHLVVFDSKSTYFSYVYLQVRFAYLLFSCECIVWLFEIAFVPDVILFFIYSVFFRNIWLSWIYCQFFKVVSILSVLLLLSRYTLVKA